ncbi:flagellar hook-associated protein 3 FlgL [Oryzisolibacter propanilivorax]|uniref:Flagellar hook-associated protein 3 FlgL n=1 Tax=Oryzisolibacter propanilivorax TaxID=1527607 RepID=A0A1G9V6X6_9BURK|nr:flagellar hook-associated protein FlgL [Oryzisolibacter propanilivorax]SDM67655.1 flagellar hook-associated protein 3 FlgL [Oryzisolibacter propanilivorax]
MTTFQRVATANMYDSALRNLAARQKSVADLQENLTAGKRVVRASDDPVAAAQAERALTRISRIQAEQRQLEVQRGSMALAESTLGDAVGLVQEMRQLIVGAGNGTLKPEDRKTYANQIQSLREQLAEVINRKDTNGAPLLGALGSALQPFVGPQNGNPAYAFNGLPGQASSSGTSIATALDGHDALMFDVRRDAVFNASISNTATPPNPLGGRNFGTDTVKVTNPQSLQQATPPSAPYNYTVEFSAVSDNGDGTYDISYAITSNNPGYTAPATQTISGLKADQLASIPISITDPGGATLEFNVKATPTKNPDGSIHYSPVNGDTVTLQPSTGMMDVVDRVVSDLRGASDGTLAAQAVSQALAHLDIGMERLHNIRGYAGELLNRADRIASDQETRSIQLEGDRSRAEDLDMVQGISDFQNANVGYQAALQSYAQVQRMTLLDFMR